MRALTIALLLVSSATLAQESAASEHGGVEAPVEPAENTIPTDESDAPPETPGTGDAEQSAEPEPENGRAERRAARVGLVLVGSPDEEAQAASQALLRALRERGLRPLSDDAVQAALLGQGSEDGLDELRTLRRQLGRTEAQNATLLRSLRDQRRDIWVLIRPRGDAFVAEVFDTDANAFFEETPALEDAPRFIERAGRAAIRRRSEAPSVQASVPSPAEVAQSADAADNLEAPDLSEEGSPAAEWFRSNWAYVVAGALLVGVITFFAVRAAGADEVPDPVLRFRTGL